MDNVKKPLQYATYLIRQISEQKLSPLKLTRHQRAVCVRFMLIDQKWSHAEIGEILMCHRTTVTKIKRRISEQDSWMLDDVDERKIALKLLQIAEAAVTRLFKKGDERSAFEVYTKHIGVLQDLGYLSKEPVRSEGKFSFLEMLKIAATDKEPPKSGDENSGNGQEEGTLSLSDSQYLEKQPRI